MTRDEKRPTRRPAKVLIVDDHPVVRDGLAAQLVTESDLELCGQAEDVAGALAQIESAQPDVVIIDISLKLGNGIDLIKRLRARNDGVRILVWSMYPESLYAERALRAGAQGYLNKGQATGEILDALRTVLAGKIYLSGNQSDQLLQRLIAAGKNADRSPVDTLSDRELEAFVLMGHGQTTEQIAKKMHISPKTVETFRARIKDKLDLKNISELIQCATRWVVENG
jgi:DNA-binding NarL/FixJ family response regulator